MPEDKKNEKTLLFCYGTLKRGGSNHEHFMVGCEFMGSARLSDDTTLYTNGSYPMMVPCEPGAEGAGVEGEIFSVDTQALRRLDSFEGHPSLFKRSPVTLSETAMVGKVEDMKAVHEGPVYAYVFQRPVDRMRHLGTSFPV